MRPEFRARLRPIPEARTHPQWRPPSQYTADAQDELEGATDDAELVLRLGEPVHVVDGDPGNIKLTSKEDLSLLRSILRVPPPKERPVHKRF